MGAWEKIASLDKDVMNHQLGVNEGNETWVPSRNGASQVQPPDTYKIQRGDTFWDLEKKWKIPFGTLKERNSDLDPKKLQIGTVINVMKDPYNFEMDKYSQGVWVNESTPAGKTKSPQSNATSIALQEPMVTIDENWVNQVEANNQAKDELRRLSQDIELHSFEFHNHALRDATEINSIVPFDGIHLQKICNDCLDPSTVGNNIFGLTYPGGSNPKTYGGDYSYSYIPSRLSEYPAIGHDRRYDNLNIVGAEGLFTNMTAIGADWRFVLEELMIAKATPDPITKLQAYALGFGLGACALPKTLYYFFTRRYAIYEFEYWYRESNYGVTNIPSIHSH